MNILSAVLLAGTGGLVGLLINLLIIGIIMALIWWVITLIPFPPGPWRQIVLVVFAVIAVIIVIQLLLGFMQ